MPREGYKTITISEETFLRIKEIYDKQKSYYRRQGVTSFSGFVEKYLHSLAEREEKRILEG